MWQEGCEVVLLCCAVERVSSQASAGIAVDMAGSVKGQAMQSERVSVYRPNERHETGYFRTWAVMIRNILTSRDLILQLFRRDFVGGYKKSFLGLSWLVVAPLMGIVSWVFFQKTGVLAPGDVGVPYVVYVMVGSTMWGFFMGMFSAAQRTLAAGSDLIQQIKYPHEVLLFQQAAQQLVNSLIALAGNLVIMLFFGVVPCWTTILLPAVLLPLFLLAAGIGLVAAMVAVVAFDLSRATNMALGLLMFVTPIIYAPDRMTGKWVSTLVHWNPLTHLVCSARDVVLYGRLFDPVGYAVAAVFGFVVFMLCWRLFYVCEDKLVERMV
jgi:lipopolysaccharide transport system permease protein